MHCLIAELSQLFVFWFSGNLRFFNLPKATTVVLAINTLYRAVFAESAPLAIHHHPVLTGFIYSGILACL
jgi:hypothetical protein